MTWDQQEALRERQQDAEIAARVRAFNSVPYRMPLPYLPRYKASSYECWQCNRLSSWNSHLCWWRHPWPDQASERMLNEHPTMRS